MRLFLALEIPQPLRQAILTAVAEQRRRLPGARWLGEQALHVTLSFLGEVEADRLADLVKVTESACHEVEPFSLEITGAGAFPPRRPARVLWLGLEASPAIALPSLQRRVDQSARAVLGLEAETRPFLPHLTLARCRSPWPLTAVERYRGAFDSPRAGHAWSEAFTVDRAVLFRSHLEPAGARYEALAELPLGGAP